MVNKFSEWVKELVRREEIGELEGVRFERVIVGEDGVQICVIVACVWERGRIRLRL